MAYTKLNVKGKFKGTLEGKSAEAKKATNLVAYKEIALTTDTLVGEVSVINLTSVTASKVLTVNVPSGALFIVKNADATNAATIKCSATDTGATLAKSTSGIYVNVEGVATLVA